MKKKITIMLTTTLAFLFLFSAVTYGEYYNRGYGNDYYDDYEDYEYRFDNASYHLDRYRGPVYYHHHPRADVYFVLVGDATFVIPAYTFRPYLRRHNFMLVPRTRFISLSCCGLDYYDSYLRFNYYFDFYNHTKWSRNNHYRLRRDFRNYYHSRRNHKWYHTNRHKVMQERDSYRHHNEYRSKGYNRTVVNKSKKYDDNRNYKYSKYSSKSQHYKSGKSKKQIKKRSDKKKDSHSSYRSKLKKKSEKR